MQTKNCSRCKAEKPSTDFYKDASVKDGLSRECRECQRARVREYKRKALTKQRAEKMERIVAEHGEGNIQSHKVCPHCGWKPRSQFPKDTRGQGVVSACLSCRPKTACRERTPEQRATARIKYKVNRDKTRAARGEYQRLWMLRNASRLECNLKVNQAKKRAKKAGAVGAFTPQEWLDLCGRYGNKCLRCGTSEAKLTVDHVVPFSKGGTNFIDNIQPLCTYCNSAKKDNCTDYRPVKGV